MGGPQSGTVENEYVYAANIFVVTVDPKADRTQVTAALERAGAILRSDRGTDESFLVEVSAPTMAVGDQMLAAVKGIPGIVTADYEAVLFSDSTPPILGQGKKLPSDGDFNDQWNLDNTPNNGGTTDADIDAPEAWFVRDNASGIKIGVIDSGINTSHPEFSGLSITRSDFTGTGNTDNDGHGTAVASIIAADWETVGGSGMAGIAKDSTLYIAKVYNTGAILRNNLKNALIWLRNQNVDIINMSLGGNLDQSHAETVAVKAEVQACSNAGILMTCSAGNDGITVPYNYSPAVWSTSISNLISVGGSTWSDGRASGSNYSSTRVQLFAPSGDYSANSGGLPTCGGIGEPPCDADLDGGGSAYGVVAANKAGGYIAFSGTSAAAPHVAGALALIMKHFPGEATSNYRTRLYEGVDDKNAFIGSCVTGGRLNVRRSLSKFGLFASTTGHGNSDWRYPQKSGKVFGWISDGEYPFVLHQDGTRGLGWIYIDPTGTPGTTSINYYSYLDAEWYYVSDSDYESVYRYADSTWYTLSSLIHDL